MRGRATGGAWGGGGGASSMRREAPTAERLLWEGMRGAHMKHFVHGCDVGRVPAQRLVKRRRVLPSKKGRMWEEGGNMRGRARGGAWGGGGGASSVCREDTQLRRLCWPRAGAERTLNMLSMVVTLDVSQLSGWLNAAAACRVKREACG